MILNHLGNLKLDLGNFADFALANPPSASLYAAGVDCDEIRSGFPG